MALKIADLIVKAGDESSIGDGVGVWGSVISIDCEMRTTPSYP